MNAPQNLPRETPWDVACGMENDLEKAMALTKAIARVAETLESDDARIVQRLAWEVDANLSAAEDKRGQLFHALHPNRDAA